MTVHLSARLAWHMDGWNGHVCRNPTANTFCVGNFSYPGDQIRVGRRLEWETANAGRSRSKIDGIPPCVYSINAFGKEPITGYSDPPDWYPAEERLTWQMPASTVCIWPFEEMYRDEVKRLAPYSRLGEARAGHWKWGARTPERLRHPAFRLGAAAAGRLEQSALDTA